jgi:hypothetical protein
MGIQFMRVKNTLIGEDELAQIMVEVYIQTIG